MQDDRIRFSEVPATWWHSALLGIYLIVAAAYIAWRLETTVSHYVWFSVPLFLVELYSAFTTILHLVLTRRIVHPTWRPAPSGHTVDAFIPTYNESSEIVEMTALGALNIVGIRNVFILDDGARDHIREVAERVGAIYLSRDDNLYAKAGNMNHGLRHSDAEFVIFLDCDHVPQSSFIKRTLGYFANQNLAFVQTPQVFYNYSSSIQFRRLSFRSLWNEQTMFYENIQPSKNRFNAAFFCGSGAMLRRSALDSVGGFATGTATEDIHTSLRLHANGWDSIFLDEVLAVGIAAEDFSEYHAQRVRWGAGSLGLLFRTSDSPLVKRGLSPMQRLCYLSSTGAYLYSGIIRLVFLVIPVVILFGAPLFTHGVDAYFRLYLTASIPFFVLSILVTYLYSRKTFHLLYSEQYNIANILACLLALKGIVRVQKKFRVSVKIKQEKEHSSAFYFIFGLAAIMVVAQAYLFIYWSVAMAGSSDKVPSSAILLSLFWNTYNLVFVLSLVRFLHRFNQRPVVQYPFHPHSTHVRFSSGQVGRLRSVGLQGAIVSTRELPREAAVQIEIKTRNDEIAVAGTITGHDRYQDTSWIRVEFDPLTFSQRRELTRYFFEEVIQDHYSRDFMSKPSNESSKPRPRAQPSGSGSRWAPTVATLEQGPESSRLF